MYIAIWTPDYSEFKPIPNSSTYLPTYYLHTYPFITQVQVTETSAGYSHFFYTLYIPLFPIKYVMSLDPQPTTFNTDQIQNFFLYCHDYKPFIWCP
jgi:hypothetical protein